MELERRAQAQAGKKGAREPFLAVYRTMGENLLHRLRYDRSEQVPQVSVMAVTGSHGGGDWLGDLGVCVSIGVGTEDWGPVVSRVAR